MAASACGASTPGVASGTITVAPTDHLGWDQASTTGLLSDYTYRAYVDDQPQDLTNASCQATSDAAGQCTSPLPVMTAGLHRLQLATVQRILGLEFESLRSETLQLNVTSAVTSQFVSLQQSATSRPMTIADGTRLNATMLASTLVRPSAIAPLPDGRLMIAEAAGDIRVWDGATLLTNDAARLTEVAQATDVGLVGLAPHPDFVRNHALFAAYTARVDDHTLVNRVVRFREFNNVLIEPQVLLEDAASEAPQRTPRIRFGPDGKLYVAFPAGRTRTDADDPATYVGKVLRLNEDGTTPRDNTGFSPIVSSGRRMPAAFDWQPGTGLIWTAERDWSDRDVLTAGLVSAPRLAFDVPVDPAAAMFYTGTTIPQLQNDLLIAGLDGEQIRRVSFEATNSRRIVSTEPLFGGVLGRIADVVQGSDGAIYLCTSNATSGDDRIDKLVRIRAATSR